MASTLSDIANELYALPPAEFTAARNAAAAAASPAARDRVKRLPKPSASAWLVNMLARHEVGLVDRVIDVGERLRAAQDDLDRSAMTEVSKERRTVLRELTRVARDLASRFGASVTAAAVSDVEQTLIAAMSDTDAAAAVRAGLLVRSLRTNGLDPVDLEGATATDAPARRPRSAAAVPSASAAERAREAAREELEQAQAELDASAKAAASVDARIEADGTSRALLEGERDDLREQLDSVTDELAEVDATLRVSRRESTSAHRDLARAQAAADRAQKKVDG